MSTNEFSIAASMENLPGMVDFVKSSLEKCRLDKKQVMKTVLLAEDMLAELIQHRAADDSVVSIKTVCFFGKGALYLKCRGSSFELEDTPMGLNDVLGEAENADEDAVVRSIVRKNLQMTLSLDYLHSTNIVKISFDSSKYQQLTVTLSSMTVGILTGLILKNILSPGACSYISTNIFSTVSTMFLNAIKMIVGPLIFFSVASSVAGMGDMKSLGRLGGKVLLMYLFTSVAAIFLAYGLFLLVPMGDSSIARILMAGGGTEGGGLPSAEPNSIWRVIQNIVPANFVGAFAGSNMLQLLFLAFLLGGISGMVGDSGAEIRHALEVVNVLFVKIATLIMKAIPVAIFCSMANLMMSISFSTLAAMLKWVAINYLGFAALLVMYGILILVMARKNPFTFYRKYFEPITAAVVFNASAAALPSAMKSCRDKLGVSHKIYTFSIPLGNAINMDGCCVMLMLTVLFFAKSFGVAISPGLLFSMMVSIYFLSVGTPGVPMGCLVCVALLFAQAGIPKEALSLIMGLYPITAMVMTGTNVAGDGAVTLMVAKSEGLLDDSVYNAR